MPRLCLILLGWMLAVAPVEAGLLGKVREALPELRLRLEKIPVPSLNDLLTRQANLLDAIDSLRDARELFEAGALEDAESALFDAGDSLEGLLAPVEWVELDLEVRTRGGAWGLQVQWGILRLDFGDLQHDGDGAIIHPPDHTDVSQLEIRDLSQGDKKSGTD